MGLRIRHGGNITEYVPNNPGSNGRIRLNIRTGTGANDIVKYGFTSDITASQYCKVSFKVNNSTIRLGTSGNSTRVSYYTVSESRYTATYDNGYYVYSYTGSQTASPYYSYTGSQTTSPIYSYRFTDTKYSSNYTNSSYTGKNMATSYQTSVSTVWRRHFGQTYDSKMHWVSHFGTYINATSLGAGVPESFWSGGAQWVSSTISGTYAVAGSGAYAQSVASGTISGAWWSRKEAENALGFYSANNTFLMTVRNGTYFGPAGWARSATVWTHITSSTRATTWSQGLRSSRVNAPSFYASAYATYSYTYGSATSVGTKRGSGAGQKVTVGTNVANYTSWQISSLVSSWDTYASQSRTTGASSTATRNQAGTTITRSYSSQSRTIGATSNATRSQVGTTITRSYSRSWQSARGYMYYTNQVPSNIWSSSIYTYQASRQSNYTTNNFNV